MSAVNGGGNGGGIGGGGGGNGCTVRELGKVTKYFLEYRMFFFLLRCIVRKAISGAATVNYDQGHVRFFNILLIIQFN